MPPHTFSNTSFELVAGTAPELDSAAEPFPLDDELVLGVVINGATQTAVFEIGTRATITSIAEPFVLADGQTLDVSIDGAPSVTVTFLAVDFDNIALATAIEVAALLLPVSGSFVTLNDDGTIDYGSVTKGSSSTISITGGTAAAGLGWAAASNTGTQYFADITNATAAEVNARMTAQLTDVTVTNAAGVVTITGDNQGAQSCIQVQESLAQGALGFSTVQVCGISRDGYARDWAVAEVSTYWDFAEFHTTPATLLFPGGIERFELGWNGNEDDVLFIPELNEAIFGVDAFEGFEQWFALVDSIPATTAAAFDSALSAEVVEDFEEGWPGIPGNEDAVFTIPALTFASFDGPDAQEDFEAGWPASPGNEGDVTSIPVLTQAAFGTSLQSAETFESSTDIAYHYRVLNVATGDTMSIFLNGDEFAFFAPGVVTEASAATGLAGQINGGAQPVSASPVADNVYVVQDTPGAILVSSTTGNPPGQLVEILGEDVDPSDDWPGLYRNPAL